MSQNNSDNPLISRHTDRGKNQAQYVLISFGTIFEEFSIKCIGQSFRPVFQPEVLLGQYLKLRTYQREAELEYTENGINISVKLKDKFEILQFKLNAKSRKLGLEFICRAHFMKHPAFGHFWPKLDHF